MEDNIYEMLMRSETGEKIVSKINLVGPDSPREDEKGILEQSALDKI